MLEPQPTLTPCHPELVSGSYYRNITTSPENIKNIPFAFHTAQRHVKGGYVPQKESKTGWLVKILCHPELVSGSCHRNITIIPENTKKIPSASRTAKRKVRGDYVPQKESATGWLSKLLCHPEFISGSSPRKIIPSPENINNIPSASRTSQRHVRGGCATRKVAFTLAEVLITLGIIGVVAAMTLPTLINNYQAKETVTRLKKVYSIVNQAYLLAQNDYGTIDNWGLSNSEKEVDPDTGEIVFGDNVSPMVALFWSKMTPYMKTLKVCNDINDSRCLRYASSSLGASTKNRKYTPSVILNDGTSLGGGWIGNANCGEKEVCADFSVDINGANQPNVIGRDIFYFRVYKHKITPIGIPGDISRSFESYCLRNTAKEYNGYGCTAWVIYNENMDYLKCDGLSWNGKHKCK